MRQLLNIRTFASIGLTLGLVVGCGGGGGSSSSLAELSPETSGLMAKNISDALPGCTFNSVAAKANTVARSSRNISADLFNQATRQLKVAKYNMIKSAVLGARDALARDISQTFQGTCPTLPGDYTIIGTHDDGVDDITMTFNSFCFGTDAENSTIDGQVIMKNVGEPSPSGPIPQYSEMSTNDSGLQIAEKSSEGTFIHLIKIDDLKQTFGNGDGDPTASNPNTITADAVVIRDGRENNEFNVSGIDLSAYNSGEDEVHTIHSVTYDDPDNGKVTLSSTPMTFDKDGVMESGTLTVSGANDSSMVITPSASGNNQFTVTVGTEKIGDMNCSELDADNPLF